MGTGAHAGAPLLQRDLAHHVVFLDLGQHVQAVHDLPEDRVLAVEERLRLQADIELAIGAVRVAQASYAYRPRAVFLLAELRRDRQAGSTRPVARGIPTLDEKLRDDAVEGQAVVEPLFDELHESGGGPGRHVWIELEGELPTIRFNDHVRRRPFPWTVRRCRTGLVRGKTGYLGLRRTKPADHAQQGGRPDLPSSSHGLRVCRTIGRVCRRSWPSSRSARSAGRSGLAAN